MQQQETKTRCVVAKSIVWKSGKEIFLYGYEIGHEEPQFKRFVHNTYSLFKALEQNGNCGSEINELLHQTLCHPHEVPLRIDLQKLFGKAPLLRYNLQEPLSKPTNAPKN